MDKPMKTRLTPPEWFVLFLRDKKYPNEDKGSLNRAEFLALNNWKPRKDEEKEFNQLMSQWQNILFAEIGAKMAFYGLEWQCFKARDWLMYFSYKDQEFGLLKNYVENHINSSTFDPLDILLRNSWIEFDHLTYLLTFELMDLGLRKDLWICDRNVMLVENYLRDQETVADILIVNGGLTEVAKEKIAEAIVNKMHCGAYPDYRFFLYWYDFIMFPTIEIGRRFVKRHNVYCLPTEQEKKEHKCASSKILEEFTLKRAIVDHVQKYNINLKEQFQDIAKELLDEGLLETLPLFWGNSNQIKGDQGEHTNYSGQKLYDEWKRYKGLAEAELQYLVSGGSLEVGYLDKRKYCSFAKEENKVVSAKSLYELKSDYGLVRDFKQQMSDLQFLGPMISLWDKKSYGSNRLILSQSTETIKKSAEILGADFSDKIEEIKGYIDELDKLAKKVDDQADSLVDCYVANGWNNTATRKFSIRIKLSSLKDLQL